MANPYIVIEQKDEKKKRGALAIILAIAFVAILAIGGTFAYLTYTANQTPNRFTTDPNITADVLEPMWTNAIQADDTATDDVDEGVYASDGTAIPTAADNMLPGSVVAKNPFVVNTSKNGSNEYVGMKLQFQKFVKTTEDGSGDDGNGSYVNMNSSEVDKLLAVYAFNTGTATDATGTKSTAAGLKIGSATELGTNNNWVQILTDNDTAAGTTDGSEAGESNKVTAGKANSNGSMYFYNSATISAETAAEVTAESASDGYWNVPSTKRSAPLFTYVRYINGATQENINALTTVLTTGANSTGKNYTTDPGWRVVISGAAIQATSDNTAADHAATAAAEKWTTLLDANSVTTDTSSTSKPTAASGVRTGKDIPEATNIKPDRTV